MIFVSCHDVRRLYDLRRELGSLKNGQSRSSGKELSFISGEYAKSLKMMFALSHYTQFLTLQPVL